MAQRCSKCGHKGGPGRQGKYPNGHRWFICARCLGTFKADKQMDEQAREAAERES